MNDVKSSHFISIFGGMSGFEPPEAHLRSPKSFYFRAFWQFFNGFSKESWERKIKETV
jgi:hypothetical protein